MAKQQQTKPKGTKIKVEPFPFGYNVSGTRKPRKRKPAGGGSVGR